MKKLNITDCRLEAGAPSYRRSMVALVLFALCSCALQAQSDAERAAKAGDLSVIKNQRVLHLFGTDVKERGFAHGFLLGKDIADDLDASLESLPGFTAVKFDNRLIPYSKNQFEWDDDSTLELDGIFEGMSARLGREGLYSKTLNRALTRADISAINVIADFFGPSCSGFAVWGKRTADGAVVHGRTLDFPIGPRAIADQLIVVSELLPERGANAPARKAWVAIGWPGLIVQYTGMNSEGLVACIHDSANLKPGRTAGRCVARGLLLRRMLEEIDPVLGDAAEHGARMAAQKPTACGNLFHMSWPRTAAEKTSTTPSAVLEFDPSDRKVDIRRMDDSNALVLTNHFRVRTTPEICTRFTAISGTLAALATANKSIGLIEARKVLMSAEMPLAAHSVYFFPDKLEFYLALTHNNIMSPSVAPTAFSFKELFARQMAEK